MSNPDDEFFEDDEFFGDGDPDAETLPCPECGEPVYEESDQCPHCGMYITFDSHAWAGKPWWWIALGLLGAVAVIYLFLGIGR